MMSGAMILKITMAFWIALGLMGTSRWIHCSAENMARGITIFKVDRPVPRLMSRISVTQSEWDTFQLGVTSVRKKAHGAE
jgi:hypothetical protein